MSIEDIRERYFEWLCDKIDFDNREHRHYKALLRCLDDFEFVATVPNDYNRVIDGLNLRDEFFEEEHIHHGYLEGPCSVLEMMVAFSIRIEIDITGEPGMDALGRWFWVMIENLGLFSYPDPKFDRVEVTEIVENFVNRRYKRNGKGGIFPLLRSNKDQRKIELWYQMQDYLSENYAD